MTSPVLFSGNVVAVNRLPVILHGDCRPAVFSAAVCHLLCLFGVAVFAHGIISAEHKRKALVFIVCRNILRHTGVA